MHLLCNAVMLAEFQGDGRGRKASNRVKRAERGCARPAAQVLWTYELRLSSAVAESEKKVDRNFSTSRVQKIQNPGSVGYAREGWVQRVRGWGHMIWKRTQN